MKILNLLFICIFSIFFTSCEIDEYKPDSPKQVNTIDVALAGIVADGYISGAGVCLDLDLSGWCGINEPATITNSSGAFSFGTNTIDSGEVISYVASGGIYIATGKAFDGKLRNISQIYADGYIYVTPLTDLIAKTFLNSDVRDANSLSYSKQVIARAYSIHSDYVDQNPAAYAGVFARTQEIQQLKGLLEVAFTQANGLSLTSSQRLKLQESIKSSIVEDISTSIEPNVLNIISILQKDENLTLSDEVKTFINEQQAFIITAIESFVENTNLTLENLNEYQSELENQADIAYALLDGSGAGVLESFELNIDIFAVDDNDTIPPSTAAISDNINVTFSGVVVDGYIGSAVVCLDLDYDGLCSSGEPATTTASAGVFSFSGVNLQKDTLFPIISSGGIDSYSKKAYSGELKNIAVSGNLENNDVVISTLTDLMSIYFLNNDVKNKSTLNSSQSTFAQKMGITTQRLLSDVAKDKELFMMSIYLEHIKRFIELVVDEENIKITIKQAILSQILNSGYEDLYISRILDSVEIDLSTIISSDDKEFVQNILLDIKKVLDEMESASEIAIYTLPTFQRMLEDKLEVYYSSKAFTPLVMEVDEVIASEYDKDGAIYDVLSCELNSINNNKLTDTNSTQNRESDLVNGLTIESYIDEVLLIYPNLDLDKSSNDVLFYDLEGRFLFSFDETWIEKNTVIYVQISKNEDGVFTCYKVKLDSNLAANIDIQKVFRYSY